MESTLPAPATPISCAADEVALAALCRARLEVEAARIHCAACGTTIDGKPEASGLLVWTRGDEVRFEEPALCRGCATAIGVTAARDWEIEEEEG